MRLSRAIRLEDYIVQRWFAGLAGTVVGTYTWLPVGSRRLRECGHRHEHPSERDCSLRRGYCLRQNDRPRSEGGGRRVAASTTMSPKTR